MLRPKCTRQINYALGVGWRLPVGACYFHPLSPDPGCCNWIEMLTIHKWTFITSFVYVKSREKPNSIGNLSPCHSPFIIHLVWILDIFSLSVARRSLFNTLNLQQIADNNSHMALNRNKLRGHIATQPYGKKRSPETKARTKWLGKKRKKNEG